MLSADLAVVQRENQFRLNEIENRKLEQLHDQSLELLCVLARTHPTKAKIAAPACAERVQKAIKEKRDIQDVRPGDEDPRSHTEPSVVLSALAKDSRTAANAIDAAVKKMTEDDNVRRLRYLNHHWRQHSTFMLPPPVDPIPCLAARRRDARSGGAACAGRDVCSTPRCSCSDGI